MKKKLLIMMILVVSISLIGGCGLLKNVSGSEQSNSEDSENSSDSGIINDLREVVSGKFELKQENITLEMGTELGDVSEYVIADNYDDITMEAAPAERISEEGDALYPYAFPGDYNTWLTKNVPPYVTFTKGETVLTMNIEWVDTTAPVAEAESNWYMCYVCGDGTELEFETYDSTYYPGHMIVMSDNSGMDIEHIEVGDVSFAGRKYEGPVTFNDLIDGEVYPFKCTLTDYCGNSATCEVSVRVVYSITQKDRELLHDNGFSDSEIDSAIDDYKKNH